MADIKLVSLHWQGFVVCKTDYRIRTTPDVLHASKVVIASGMMPTRIVLRDISRAERTEYVVHMEILAHDPDAEMVKDQAFAFRHRAFESGDYFDTLDKAWERFRERASRL